MSGLNKWAHIEYPAATESYRCATNDEEHSVDALGNARAAQREERHPTSLVVFKNHVLLSVLLPEVLSTNAELPRSGSLDAVRAPGGQTQRVLASAASESCQKRNKGQTPKRQTDRANSSNFCTGKKTPGEPGFMYR